jgi:hypothetical protein
MIDGRYCHRELGGEVKRCSSWVFMGADKVSCESVKLQIVSKESEWVIDTFIMLRLK